MSKPVSNNQDVSQAISNRDGSLSDADKKVVSKVPSMLSEVTAQDMEHRTERSPHHELQILERLHLKRLHEDNQGLKYQVQQLESLSQQQGEHLFQLATVLERLNETATNQKTKFGTQAGLAASQLEQISKASRELSISRESINNETMKQNIGNIEKCASLLQSLLTNMQEMLSSQATLERLTYLQTLHSHQATLQEHIESGRTQLAELQEQIAQEEEKLNIQILVRHLQPTSMSAR